MGIFGIISTTPNPNSNPGWEDFTAHEFWVSQGSGVGRERVVSSLYAEKRDENSLGRPWEPTPPAPLPMSLSFTTQVSAHSLEMAHSK